MLLTLIVTVVLLQFLMVGWIQVQRAARRVAAQHPEAGPLRLIGGGCGGQGHGHEAEHPAAVVARNFESASEAPAEGCAACSNTACKPGVPTEVGPPDSCDPGDRASSFASRLTS